MRAKSNVVRASAVGEAGLQPVGARSRATGCARYKAPLQVLQSDLAAAETVFTFSGRATPDRAGARPYRRREHKFVSKASLIHPYD